MLRSAVWKGKYSSWWSFPGLCFPLGDSGSWYWVNVMRIQPFTEDLISSCFSFFLLMKILLDSCTGTRAEFSRREFSHLLPVMHFSVVISADCRAFECFYFIFFFCHQCSFHLIYSLMPQPRCGISKLFPWWQMGHKTWIVMELQGQGILGSGEGKSSPQKS